MKFNAIPIEEAAGKILGHNVAGTDGRRLFRKGKPLETADLEQLRALGRHSVYVAELEAGDISENDAAQRIARAARGANLKTSQATTGRANLHAEQLGILRVDVDRLTEVNLCEAVTLATLPNHAVVQPGQMVATLKIIAYALPDSIVREAELICGRLISAGSEEPQPLLRVDPLPDRSVGLILSGSPAARERIVDSFEKALRARLNSWGAQLDRIDFVPLEDESGEQALAEAILAATGEGIELLVLAGETAIMDRHDIAPRAVERAGGRITAFGAPVDPGNLLMLARLDVDGRIVPIVGAPGCARSPKQNIVDLVIPRLLAGEYLTKMDIVRLGHGGMLEDVPERGRPRRLN